MAGGETGVRWKGDERAAAEAIIMRDGHGEFGRGRKSRRDTITYRSVPRHPRMCPAWPMKSRALSLKRRRQYASGLWTGVGRKKAAGIIRPTSFYASTGVTVFVLRFVEGLGFRATKKFKIELCRRPSAVRTRSSESTGSIFKTPVGLGMFLRDFLVKKSRK